MQTLNRRDFLKLSGAALSICLLKPPDPETQKPQPIGLGRVTEWRIWAYGDARPGAQKEVALSRDDVLDIYAALDTEGLMAHNPTWFLTKYGWVYSSWMQPVKQEFNPPEQYIPEKGFWAQVTVPYVEMRSAPNDKAYRLYRLYYSSVHQVIDRLVDDRGAVWYQLKDDEYQSVKEYVRAEGLRRIPPSELAPISPFAQDKRIEVNLKDQKLYAYEGDSLVYTTRCATGAAFNVDGIGLVDFTTPVGEHTVVRKRPSRHMHGFEDRADAYDLPGVPFCTYFTEAGVAVHGAYWHNDFGHPRSHGCVNVLADAAQWVYRWSMPVAAYDEALLVVDKGGTPVIVSV
ncbi:MAG TPA: L,D-transpeptidase [Anaerolineae bacterium]|nr:L,D-transpeptidase [Anaerolineae bacterium]